MVDPIYQAWDGEPIRSLRSLTLSSAAVPETLRGKLAEIFPATDSLVCYGMTETYSITMQDPAEFTTYPASSGHAALAACPRHRRHPRVIMTPLAHGGQRTTNKPRTS